MNDVERRKAQAEAVGAAAVVRSADRARFWAGMNRYLVAEATHAQKAAEAERAFGDESSPEQSD